MDTIKPDTWFAIAKWAKENNKFGSAERKFLYDIGKYSGIHGGLSIKQAKWARSLFEQAISEGFEFEQI